MTRNNDIKKIVVISDGTGKTARRLMDAVLSQYAGQEVRYTLVDIYQEVRTRGQVNGVLRKIKNDYLVVFSIISEDLRKYLHNRLERRGVLHLNVLEPMLRTMSKFLGVHPDYRPGLLQIIDDRYYRKVDAIGYTVEHDDGRGSRHSEAELVLVGPSRCCKTPLSMYIACNFGLRVANIPIVPMDNIVELLEGRLQGVNPRSICGLVMAHDELLRAREERWNLLANDDLTKRELLAYLDGRTIARELALCRQIYQKHHWVVVDVTRRAIEEIAEELLHKIHYANMNLSHRS